MGVRLPPTAVLIRAAVLLNVLGLLLLLGVLVRISALTVGMLMLGSLLIPLGIALYVAAVVRDLRRREAL
jgi:uncharacterized membrane protein YphA (DoxX/SURF4 family)